MRKNRAKDRPITPDPRYKDLLLGRFVNSLMLDGKKSTAYAILYDALDLVEKRTGEDPLETFKTALNNVSPAVEVKSRRVGGATFQVPTEVSAKRQRSLGIKWMVKYARSRNGKSMHEKLAAEIMAAAKGEGQAVKKKDDTHRMADANKAFSHFKF